MRKIDRNLILFNVLIAILILIDGYFYSVQGNKAYYAYMSMLPILILVCFFTLFIAVIRIRRTIKSIKYAFPNERLMTIHFINFPIWFVLIVVNTGLGITSLVVDSSITSEVSDDKLRL